MERERAQDDRQVDRLERLTEITDEMFDLVSVVDLEGRFKWVSRSYNLLGYTREELIGTPALDHVHPEDRDRVTEAFTKFLGKKGGAAKITYRYEKADETYLWIETMGKFLYNAAGEAQEILFSSRDISARVATQQKLEKSEREKRVLVDSLDEMIFLLDSQMVYREVHVSSESKLYMDKERVIGCSIDEVGFPEPAHGIIKGATVRVLRTGDPERVEYYLDLPEGRKWYDARITRLRTTAGEESGVLSIVRDITDRVEMEQALERERQRFSGILEATRAGTWEWNVQTGELIINERWAEIVGYRLEELEPVSIETWRRFAHPEDFERSEHQLKKLFAGEADYYEMRARMRHRAGYWVWVADRGNVRSWTEDGKPLWVSGTHIDITAEREMSEALQERTEELARFFKVNLDLMAIVDMRGRFLRLNREWETVLGYAHSDLIDRPFMDFVHPEDRQMTQKVFEQQPITGEVRDFINRYRCKDGTYRSIEWRSQSYGDLIYAAARDVTARQEERRALRRMVESSGYFLGLASESLDYQKITDDFLTLSGGKAAFFNLYDENGRTFTTKALSGEGETLKKAAALLGFSIVDKTWDHDPVRAERIADRITTRFESLSVLTGETLPGSLIRLIEKTFRTGEAVLVKIMRQDRMLGDFTLVMDRDKRFDQEEMAEIFSNQLGLAIARHRAEEASLLALHELERSEEQYRILVDEIDQGLALYELLFDEAGEPSDFRVVSVNEAFEQMSNLKREEAIGRRASELYEGFSQLWLDRFARVALTGESAHYEDYLPETDRYFSLHGYCPKHGYFAVLMEEITERQRLKEKLAGRDRLLTKLSQQVPGGIYQYKLEPNGRSYFPFASEGIESIYEIGPEVLAVDASPVFDRILPEDLEEVKASIAESADNLSIWRAEYRVQLPERGRRWVQGIARPERLEDGAILWYGYLSDITELKVKQKEIEYLSFHDALTGLYNRRYIEDAMDRLDRSRQLPLTVMVLDVNGLKLMNDAFGHTEGDHLLVTVSRVLEHCCRAEDLIGRMGGDEFIVLLPQTSEEEAEKIRQRILVAAEEETDGVLPVSVAIGLATKTEASQSLAAIEKHADHQMYKDKRKRGRKARLKAVQLVLERLEETIRSERAHLEGVQKYSLLIARGLDLSEEERQRIGMAARMHDIGKVALPVEILNRESPLSDAERRMVEQHPEIGYQILRSVEHYGQVAEIIWHHHEHWDGSGYPLGLKGDKIPQDSRILTIADAFESMTGQRGYKQTMTRQEAVEELKRCAGTQFDPKLVAAFCRALEEGQE